MGATINYNFPIYDDDWPPDLTSTGAEAQAIIDIDTELKKQETQESEDASRLNQLIQDERTERTDADTSLQTNIGKETEERKAADSELKSSVENVENELTGVSADVTGVFGLTYGDDNVNFIEKSGDTYSSPALVEIQRQIADASAAPAWETVTDKPFETLGDGLSVADGVLSASGGSTVNSIAPLTTNNAPLAEEYSFAAGYGASAYVGNGVAIGNSAYVTADYGTSIGTRANSQSNAIALGTDTDATSNALAFGAKVKARGASSIGIGYAAATYGGAAIAIGTNTQGNTESSVAIGNIAVVDGKQSVAVGGNAQSIGAYCVSVGAKSCTTCDYSVALGVSAQTSRDYELSIGSGTPGSSAEVTRLIAHVSDPEEDTDAVNMRHLDNALTELLGTVGEILQTVSWSDLEAES
jgi:trimeric autotransporter adhesin